MKGVGSAFGSATGYWPRVWQRGSRHIMTEYRDEAELQTHGHDATHRFATPFRRCEPIRSYKKEDSDLEYEYNELEPKLGKIKNQA